MTRLFSKKHFVRIKTKQIIKNRIKFQHLSHVTSSRWKKANHIRKIYVSILLIIDT